VTTAPRAFRYEKLVRAGSRLPPPYWVGPTVPGHNETHDALVKVWRVEKQGRRSDGIGIRKQNMPPNQGRGVCTIHPPWLLRPPPHGHFYRHARTHDVVPKRKEGLREVVPRASGLVVQVVVPGVVLKRCAVSGPSSAAFHSDHPQSLQGEGWWFSRTVLTWGH